MANWTVARRVLTPMPVVRLYYYWKFRTRISPRAEVVPLAEQGLVTRGIRIGSRVRLGPACVVLDGAEIADDQVVPRCTVVRGPYAPTGGKRLTPSRVVLPDR